MCFNKLVYLKVIKRHMLTELFPYICGTVFVIDGLLCGGRL